MHKDKKMNRRYLSEMGLNALREQYTSSSTGRLPTPKFNLDVKGSMSAGNGPGKYTYSQRLKPTPRRSGPPVPKARGIDQASAAAARVFNAGGTTDDAIAAANKVESGLGSNQAALLRIKQNTGLTPLRMSDPLNPRTPPPGRRPKLKF